MLRADRFDIVSGSDSIGAAPALTFGERGTIAKGAYLLCDDVPSNLAGWVVPLYNAVLTEVFVTMSTARKVSFDIQKRISDAPVTFTTIQTITIDPASRITVQTIDLSVDRLDELVCRVSPTSANRPKSPKLGFIIKGDST
jgi:hypothetical protein